MMRRSTERRQYARVDGGGWSYIRPGLAVVYRRGGRTFTVRLRWFLWLAITIGVLAGAWL